MKFLVATILYALTAFAAGLYFPWWIIAITSFIVAVLIHQRALVAFISAFIGVSLLWGGVASYIDINNGHLLSAKIANVLPLGGSYIALVVVTALVGGLVSGFAALTGSYVRSRPVASRAV